MPECSEAGVTQAGWTVWVRDTLICSWLVPPGVAAGWSWLAAAPGEEENPH